MNYAFTNATIFEKIGFASILLPEVKLFRFNVTLVICMEFSYGILIEFFGNRNLSVETNRMEKGTQVNSSHVVHNIMTRWCQKCLS